MITGQVCPICKKEVRKNERYSKYLCQDCATRTTDENGIPVWFSDGKYDPKEDVIQIGFYGMYEDRDEYDSNICYVNGVKCKAEPARFGGIVIQVA